ncbi:glycosyltransferase family 2 protein [Sphingobium sufflavum]|uniref:glycosyltransferase family 2 protein n=1 Tax=Sphingobium sufflavum TaxID=1129547 RepID=UPI001F22CF95|nr:glycosyltransferase family 2 protein [Sphingobium sufflavum]MCE7798309.1 glycosyltransferase family 2 protein [Sphingobium sufflavum]
MTATVTRPEYSIVIPHRDDLVGLNRTLAALTSLSPLSPSFEVIVADNASRHGGHAAEQCAAAYSVLNVRVISVPETGAGPARNGGASIAQGSRLAFLDCDCLPSDQWLIEADVALQHADVVGGPVTVTLGEIPLEQATPAALFDLFYGFDSYRSFHRDGLLLSGNLVMPRALFDQVGSFRSGISEDRDWCIRAHAMGAHLSFCPALSIEHVALSDPDLILRRWARVTRETRIFYAAHGFHWTRWIGYCLAVALSPAIHGWRIFQANHLKSASMILKIRVMLLLIQVRLSRAWLGVRLVKIGKPRF